MEQIDLVKRYLLRLERNDKGENGCNWEDRRFLEDDVYSFFIHCHQLKDWIFKLNVIGITQSMVKDFIDDNQSLVLCANLANQKKHCTRDKVGRQKKSRATPSTRIVASTYTTSEFGLVTGVKGKFEILAGDNVFDALKVARECVELWERFINYYKR